MTETVDEAVYSSVLAAYGGIADILTSIPPEVIAAISTGVPTALDYSLVPNPAGAFQTSFPAFFTDPLPVVQSYLEEQESAVASALSSLGYLYTEGLPALESRENDSGDTATETEESTVTTSATRTAETTAVASDGALSSDDEPSGDDEPSSDDESSGDDELSSASRASAAAPPSEDSNTSNPAAKPTGAVAASMAGLVGVLGVAAFL